MSCRIMDWFVDTHPEKVHRYDGPLIIYPEYPDNDPILAAKLKRFDAIVRGEGRQVINGIELEKPIPF